MIRTKEAQGDHHSGKSNGGPDWTQILRMLLVSLQLVKLVSEFF